MGGNIYFASVNGVLTVVEAGGDYPKILHQAKFKNGLFASPAVYEGSLYLRTREAIYRFDPEANEAL